MQPFKQPPNLGDSQNRKTQKYVEGRKKGQLPSSLKLWSRIHHASPFWCFHLPSIFHPPSCFFR
jgi:hypothetical protein